MKVAIIGAGRVGSVLGRVLVENGHTITCIVSRTLTSARRAGRFLGCRNISTSFDALPPGTDIVFIATPHGAVEQVAREVSQLRTIDFTRVSFCHASGMLSALALEPLRRRGARVFSFHPLQTFPRSFEPKRIVPTASGIYYGVDGSRRALRVAHRFARALGGKTIDIRPSMRPYYHAACVVASNHLTAMLSILELMFRTLRTTESDFFPVFKPIIMATLGNIERTSPTQALSGPVARGGVDTVKGHFAAIRRYTPELVPYFRQLTLETVTLAAAKGTLTARKARAIRALVRSHLRPIVNRKEIR